MSEAVADGAVLSEGGPCGLLNLRGDPASARFRDAAKASSGVDLPRTPNTYQRVADCTAYWLAPDEWLLAMPDGEQAAMENRLRKTLADRHFSVVDVSGSYLRLVLAGTGARTVLQQASPYDFHPKAFAPGRCVQTVFAKATALIAAEADASFVLLVRASYADYIRRWVATALGA